MYIANQNFKMGSRMVRRGEQLDQVSNAHIDRGLVREAKIIKPTEVQDVIEQPIIKRRGRKPKAKTESVEQQNDTGIGKPYLGE